MKIRLVSGFVKTDANHRSAESYHELGDHLRALPVDFDIYEDSIEDTWLWQYVNGPEMTGREIIAADDGNWGKNTIQYHCANHQKSEWLLRAAKDHPDADVLVWMDYGIYHLYSDGFGYLFEGDVERLFQRIAADDFAIPGILREDEIPPVGDMGLQWRFSGSTMIIPTKYVEEWDRMCKEVAKSYIYETGVVTWEVNTWTRVESLVRQGLIRLPIRWYPGRHDRDIITNYQPHGIEQPVVEEQKPKVHTPLCALAWKHGTNKADMDFTPGYYKLLQDRKVENLLELGIGAPGLSGGPSEWAASLFMWREFFPEAIIYGADCRMDLMVEGEERIHTDYVDVRDGASLWGLVADKPMFDVIVDDAVHEPDVQMRAFDVLRHKLKYGGLYFVDDWCPEKDPGLKILKAHLPDGWEYWLSGTRPEARLLALQQTWIYDG